MAKMKIKVKDLGGSGGISDPAEDYGYSGTAPAKEKPVVKSGVKLVKVEVPAKERPVRVENSFVKQKRRWPWVILSLVIGFIAGVSYQQYRARQALNTLANNFTENYEQARNEIANQLEEYNSHFSGNDSSSGSGSSSSEVSKPDRWGNPYGVSEEDDLGDHEIWGGNTPNFSDESSEGSGSNVSNEVSEVGESTTIMRPDFKQFMDEYEAFVDDYVEFMTKYQSGQLSMNDVMRYATITAEYAEMSQKVEKLKNDNLTTEEMNYYIEVTSRVAKKLNGVASSMVK